MEDSFEKKRKKDDNDDEIYFRNLRNKENSVHECSKHLIFNKNNWSLLIDWMVVFCYDASFLEDTLFLSFYILLHYYCETDFKKKNVQLNTSTAISLASKIREVSDNQLSLKNYICEDDDFTKEDISENEYTMCDTLKWNLEIMTEIDFLSRYGRYCTKTEKTFAMFIIEQTFYSLYLVQTMLPSLRVVCALFLTSKHYKNEKLWTEDLRKESRHSKEDIIKFSKYMNNYLTDRQNEFDKHLNSSSISASYIKYSRLLSSLRYKYIYL